MGIFTREKNDIFLRMYLSFCNLGFSCLDFQVASPWTLHFSVVFNIIHKNILKSFFGYFSCDCEMNKRPNAKFKGWVVVYHVLKWKSNLHFGFFNLISFDMLVKVYKWQREVFKLFKEIFKVTYPNFQPYFIRYFILKISNRIRVLILFH